MAMQGQRARACRSCVIVWDGNEELGIGMLGNRGGALTAGSPSDRSACAQKKQWLRFCRTSAMSR